MRNFLAALNEDSLELTLEELINPLTVEEFIRNYWETSFHHLVGPPDRFENLISWSCLNRILETQRMVPPRLIAVRSGVRIDPRIVQYKDPPYLLKSKELLAQLRAGATLVVNSLQEVHQPVRELASAVQASFRAPVSANLYAAWKYEKGLAPHFDAQENLILQVYGRKFWQIWKPDAHGVANGSGDAAGPPSDSPCWEGVLESGSLLYVPCGWWHSAAPLGEPSMHLTISVVPYTGNDFLSWIAQRCAESELPRRKIPFLREQRDLEDYSKQLSDGLRAFCTAEGLALFLRERTNGQLEYPCLNLPSLD
jgi:ribosomal protein L16 Arg81 hydroxylase